MPLTIRPVAGERGHRFRDWLVFRWCQRGAAAIPLLLAMSAMPSVPAADGAAVVELYVSEGCSSCPPAEALAADLVHEAAAAHARLFYLEFPVDYWDYLGWKDLFARPEFAARQESWARRLGLAQIGTPQAIVGGATAILGSDGAALRAAIARAQAHADAVAITAKARWADDGLHVAIQLAQAPGGAEVSVALSESALSSAIRAGENNGRTLVHDDVVRAFTELPATGELQDVRLTAPETLVRAHAAVTVVVQDGGTHAVLGAERIIP